MPASRSTTQVTRRVTHDAELLLVMVGACVCAYFLVWRPVREGPRSGRSAVPVPTAAQPGCADERPSSGRYAMVQWHTHRD